MQSPPRPLLAWSCSEQGSAQPRSQEGDAVEQESKSGTHV